jgi:hypothetical protein
MWRDHHHYFLTFVERKMHIRNGRERLMMGNSWQCPLLTHSYLMVLEGNMNAPISKLLSVYVRWIIGGNVIVRRRRRRRRKLVLLVFMKTGLAGCCLCAISTCMLLIVPTHVASWCRQREASAGASSVFLDFRLSCNLRLTERLFRRRKSATDIFVLVI